MAITTNRDYLIKALAKFNVSEDDVDVMLLDSPNLLPDATPDVRGCKLAIYASMSTILPLANIGESGYSISWNIEALKMWYNALCVELGKENLIGGKPKIRDRSNSW
jgi:hypothetical protein